MLDGTTDTRAADIITIDETNEPTPRDIAAASLAARCAEASVVEPSKPQLAAIRRKAVAGGTSFDDELDAWIKRARRRADNVLAKELRTARKSRLTHRSARMARALAVRGEKTIRRERPAPAEVVEGQGPDIRFCEIDNPYYSWAHSGAPGNPAEIVVARNMSESTIVRLSETGGLTPAEAQAGLRFCRLYEQAGRNAPSPSDLKQRVDGGGAADAFSPGRVRAGFELREAHEKVGAQHYGVARYVAGEGHTLRELRVRLRCSKFRARQALREALDALAAHWGLASRASTKAEIDDADVAEG